MTYRQRAVAIYTYFRSSGIGEPISTFTGFSLGITMAMQHPEWAQKWYEQFMADDAAPDPTNTVNQLLLVAPIEVEG